MKDFKKSYPDVEICSVKDCPLNDIEHEMFYKYEQYKEDSKKSGKILVYSMMNQDMSFTQFFQWWNGRDWVRL